MNSNNKLKEFGIKNHTRYYFDDIINIHDPDIDNNFVRKKS